MTPSQRATSVDETLARRVDARRNRAAILQAAQQLFAAEGLDAQMPDVARAADVGIGTVYRHFPSKDDLIAAFVAGHFERVAQKARDCLEMDDSWEAISAFVRFSAQIQAADRGLTQVTATRPDLMDAAAQVVGMPALLDELVKRAQHAGTLRLDLTWEDIPTVVCGLGSATQQVSGPATGRWPRLVEIIIDGLRAPAGGTLPQPLSTPAQPISESL